MTIHKTYKGSSILVMSLEKPRLMMRSLGGSNWKGVVYCMVFP